MFIDQITILNYFEISKYSEKKVESSMMKISGEIYSMTINF